MENKKTKKKTKKKQKKHINVFQCDAERFPN